jgi:PAS domain S-box-containing protein
MTMFAQNPSQDLHETFGTLNIAWKQEPNYIDALEAELNARAEALNQTALVTITDLHGTILYANDLFCSVTGHQRNRVIGHTHNIIRDPELSDKTVENIWKTIRAGQVWKGDMKSRRKDSSVFWTQMTIVPVLGDDQQPVRYVWVRHDVTDLKEKEVSLRTMKENDNHQLVENVSRAGSFQRTVLPEQSALQSIFPSSFLIFSPKHQVSGDFYWFRKTDDESVIVLGDGTGHGVSAAMISMMTLGGIKFAVNEMKITDPGTVLNQLSHFLYRALGKDQNSNLQESVDMAFCRFNHRTNVLHYSTGKGCLYLVSDGELAELSYSSSSIGSEPGEHNRYESHSIQLKRGDRVFMLTDGLADQLGGERDKRYGSQNVKEVLLYSGHTDMIRQKEVILKNYLNWKGTNEQTDDLTMIAFQVS